MKNSYKIVTGVAVALSLGVAAAAFAHPGPMGGGMGHGMRGDMGQGMMMHGGPAGTATGQQLMTPDERSAMMEKMRSAKTPEERQKLADANHAQMEQRAKDKGITLPHAHGPRAGFGPNATPPAAGTR
ncbi:MAG: hypothetical protein WCO67_26705 [Betaproteobacteria bacterium]